MQVVSALVNEGTAQFVDLSSSLQCPICTVPYHNPQLLMDCGHSICGQCLQSVIFSFNNKYTNNQSSDRNQRPQCAICRQVINNYAPNLVLKQLVSEQLVQCPNDGCKLRISFDQINNHILNQCPYSRVECTNEMCGSIKCQWVGIRLQYERDSHSVSCTIAHLKQALTPLQAEIQRLQDKVRRQDKELNRIREFVRTNKTRLDLNDVQMDQRIQAEHDESCSSSASLSSSSDHGQQDNGVEHNQSGRGRSRDITEHQESGNNNNNHIATKQSIKDEIVIREHKGGVTSLSLAFNESAVFSGSYHGQILAFGTTDGINLPLIPVSDNDEQIQSDSVLNAHSGTIWSLAWNQRSNTLYSGASDKLIKVWDIEKVSTDPEESSSTSRLSQQSYSLKFRQRSEFRGHEGKIYALLSINDLLFSSSSDRTVRVWKDMGSYNSLNSPDNTGNNHNNCCLSIFREHSENVNCLSEFQNGEYSDSSNQSPHSQQVASSGLKIVSGSSDRTIKLWDVERGECILTLPTTLQLSAQSGNVVPSMISGIENTGSEVLDVSSGAGLIFASTYDATIEIFDPRTISKVGTLIGHNWEVWQIQYAGRNTLFSASFDHQIKRWDLRNLSCNMTLTGHSGYVHALTCSDQFLVSGCADKTVRIWR
ncbi:hypothetical protein MIR68_007510 [Amoeboaphelidium protococcarum]|nr:hypothetical protein MIR68_007510 [Amoeboaphelidium protococcarum]